MPKTPIFPLSLFLLPCMFDVYVLKIAKWFQWSGKGFFRMIWDVWISSGLSGCCILLQNVSQDAGGGDLGHREGTQTSLGELECAFLFLMDHPPFALPTQPIQGVSLWSDRTRVPPSLCRSVFVLTGWGRAIHCVGLDNYIFYIKQSQKLEQMPLWWQSERLHNFFFILT